ncbi:MAG: primosomal protein N' [Gammaproteobacteria bacterium]
MSEMILRVAVPSPLLKLFDYLAPAGCDPVLLRPGMRLRVPFGRTKTIGILLEVRADSSIRRDALRAPLEILDAGPVLPADLIELLQWAQAYYHHPHGEVYATALPVLLRQGKPARRERLRLWRITQTGHEIRAEGALKRAPRQRALLDYLARHTEGVASERLRLEWPGWSATAKSLLAKGWVEFSETPAATTTVAHAEAPHLSAEQDRAVAAVSTALGGFQAFLLEGVTGSGKTEVYIRIAQAALAQGHQALVLVPEIGLTPQLLARFQNRLPGPFAILHSGLSDRERLNAWVLAREGEATVVIGTRSAIFTPLPRLGVVIVDEEHDLSFKQQDGFRYHARDLAVVRARQRGVPVLLGSATPALESLANAERGRYQRLVLTVRVGDAVAPTLELLDVRRQAMEDGLSTTLLRNIEDHLRRGGQALLFLNRRGFAPTLICHECGWLHGCTRCTSRLTLHLRRRQLICHHCGLEQPLPSACPECGSVDLRALGQGTERIERALKEVFPALGIARIDRDSTRRKGSLQSLLDDIHEGTRRILIGTQMLAKGHHFPNVTLVAIVDADQGLFGADFRASERMAQLIIQVAGRAGRADKPGTVLIQTHHPGHPLLQTLTQQGYGAFAAETLRERQETVLPPFAFQALLRADATEPEPPHAFLREALALGADIAEQVELLGPIPAPMEKRAGRYRAQLLAQAEQRQMLHPFLDAWLERITGLKSSRKVRWSLDVDPLDML